MSRNIYIHHQWQVGDWHDKLRTYVPGFILPNQFLFHGDKLGPDLLIRATGQSTERETSSDERSTRNSTDLRVDRRPAAKQAAPDSSRLDDARLGGKRDPMDASSGVPGDRSADGAWQWQEKCGRLFV